MNLEEYSKYDALGLAELVKKGEVTKEELASLAQQGLNKVDGDLNNIIIEHNPLYHLSLMQYYFYWLFHF